MMIAVLLYTVFGLSILGGIAIGLRLYRAILGSAGAAAFGLGADNPRLDPYRSPAPGAHAQTACKCAWLQSHNHLPRSVVIKNAREVPRACLLAHFGVTVGELDELCRLLHRSRVSIEKEFAARRRHRRRGSEGNKL